MKTNPLVNVLCENVFFRMALMDLIDAGILAPEARRKVMTILVISHTALHGVYQVLNDNLGRNVDVILCSRRIMSFLQGLPDAAGAVIIDSAAPVKDIMLVLQRDDRRRNSKKRVISADSLSNVERMVLCCIKKGMSIRQISADSGLSYHYISHIKRCVMRELDVCSEAGLFYKSRLLQWQCGD